MAPGGDAQRVLILGATSAIAADVARAYARRGAALYLVGRNAARLEALRAELGAAVVGARAADLDALETADAIVAAAIDALGGLDVALLAHGLLPDQRATESDVALAEQTLRTNMTSQIALLLPLANHCEAAGRGKLAVITSVAGERGRPRNYTYGAAKGGLSTYLQGVRSRLYGGGASVHDLRLGPVDTPMTIDHPKNPLFARPEQAAAAIVRAIERGRPVAYVPWFWRWIMWGVRNLPEPLFQRLGFLAGR